ncbi:hypothetical protein Efla_002771 [Eimeria flavescens]
MSSFIQILFFWSTSAVTFAWIPRRCAAASTAQGDSSDSYASINSNSHQVPPSSAATDEAAPLEQAAYEAVDEQPLLTTVLPEESRSSQLRRRREDDFFGFPTVDPPALWLNSLDSLKCAQDETLSIGDSRCEGREAWLRVSDGSAGVFFIALGDTGNLSNGLSQVSSQLARVCSSLPISFVSLLGDNFYPAGVKDHWDPKFTSHFEVPFGHASLKRVAFFPIFGNHDYRAHPEAQIQRYYSLCRTCRQPQDWNAAKVRWRFPNAWYFSRLVFNGVPLDLSHSRAAKDVAELSERKNDAGQPESGRSMVVVNVHLDSNLFLNSPVLTRQQMDFLEKVLQAAAADADWVFVHQHHPLFTDATLARNIKTYQDLLLPVYQQYGVDAIFAGHEHLLSQFELHAPNSSGGPVVQVVAGAGSKLHREEPRCCNSGRSKRCGLDELPCPSKNCIFQETVHGFMLVELSIHQMRLNFINAATGEIISHSTHASKKAERFSKLPRTAEFSGDGAPLVGGPVAHAAAYPAIYRVGIPAELTGGWMSQHPWITWLPIVFVLLTALFFILCCRRCFALQRFIGRQMGRSQWKCWSSNRQTYSELGEQPAAIGAAASHAAAEELPLPVASALMDPVSACELRKQKADDDLSLV